MSTPNPRTATTTWTPSLDALADASESVRSWLAEPGLLTDRVRACCDGVHGLRVIVEHDAMLPVDLHDVLATRDARAFVREVELTCADVAHVFAQSWIPAGTLAHAPWLTQLGGKALGATLDARDDTTRGALEFAWLVAGDPLYERAVARRGDDRPMRLAARRSWFAVGGHRLLVQEVFLPESLG